MPKQSKAAPTEQFPSEQWEHFDLYESVKKAIYALPSNFESSLRISGVLATDLFAFNSSLGATIEEQVVASLNKLRSVWDPDQKYALYDFERRPQTFPDVVLKTSSPELTPQIILGIELKGWYVLAKEREPSFRYKVTPSACADADLLVVVPWALSEVVSGTPKVFAPFVIGARFAAEYRNWHWKFKKTGKSDNTINLSTVDQHYPVKSDMISDRPKSDGGGNFGRFARTGVMDSYISELFNDRLVGIELSSWQGFLAIFTEGNTVDEATIALEKLASHISGDSTLSADIKSTISTKLREIAELLER